MALTKVTGGILSQPIDLGITTATTGFFSGIVTAQSVRVLGDLIVDGSTTTSVSYTHLTLPTKRIV